MEPSIYILSLMTALFPPRDTSQAKWLTPVARETLEECKFRYGEIAQAISDVVFDPLEDPIIKGPHGRAKTAAIVVSVAFFESSFRKDVDFGLGRRSRGGGIDVCLMQVRSLSEGLSPEDLLVDRKLCFREGLRLIRQSFLSCRSNDVQERLSAYTTGSCEKGVVQSKVRMGAAMRIFQDHQPQVVDSVWINR